MSTLNHFSNLLFYIVDFFSEKIEEALKKTEDEDFVRAEYDVEVRELEKARILKLCGVMMEEKHDFTGNGCWPDSKPLDLGALPNEEQLREILNRHKKKGKKMKERCSSRSR